MKRISVLVCLLSVMMCLLLAGCGAKENSDVSNSQYVGTWKGEKLTAAGQEVTAQEVFGGDFFLELKNDGTYVMTAGQDVTEAPGRIGRRGGDSLRTGRRSRTGRREDAPQE